jgi:hypothetical protein
MNWKRFGGKRLWPNQDTIPASTWGGGMSKTSHMSGTIVRAPSKIQTEDLLNTSLGHYFITNLFSQSC